MGKMIHHLKPVALIVCFGFLITFCGPTFGQQTEGKNQTSKEKELENKDSANTKAKESPKTAANHYIRQAILTGKVTDVNDEKHRIVLEFAVTPKNKAQATFIVTEDAKIRTRVLPTLFDDKGNLKKPTPKELLELKGKDKNLPGYESEFASLKRGQVLLVHQVTTKEKILADRQKPRPKPGEKPKMDDMLSSYIEIISEN